MTNEELEKLTPFELDDATSTMLDFNRYLLLFRKCQLLEAKVTELKEENNFLVHECDRLTYLIQ
jgi:hypothetical protein